MVTVLSHNEEDEMLLQNDAEEFVRLRSGLLTAALPESWMVYRYSFSEGYHCDASTFSVVIFVLSMLTVVYIR